MQAPDHADRKAALALQPFRPPRPRANPRLQILAAEALLLHPKLDRLDRIGRVDRIVLSFVGVDERGQHAGAVSFRRPRLGSPKALECDKSLLVVCRRADWLQVSAHGPPP